MFDKKPIELTTYDITTKHLEGAEGVTEHDCTLPLPSGPYDMTYSHFLLSFLNPEKQISLLQESYKALNDGKDSGKITSAALHFVVVPHNLAKPKFTNLPLFSVSFEDLRKNLNLLGIKNKLLEIKTGPNLDKNGFCLVLLKGGVEI